MDGGANIDGCGGRIYSRPYDQKVDIKLLLGATSVICKTIMAKFTTVTAAPGALSVCYFVVCNSSWKKMSGLLKKSRSELALNVIKKRHSCKLIQIVKTNHQITPIRCPVCTHNLIFKNTHCIHHPSQGS